MSSQPPEHQNRNNFRPEVHDRDEEGRVEKPPQRARQGEKVGHMRYVLATSILLVVIAFALAAWFVF